MAKSKKPRRSAERTANGFIAPTPGILSQHSETLWGCLNDDILPFGLDAALQKIGADAEKVLRKRLGEDWWRRANDIIEHPATLSVLFNEPATAASLAALHDKLTDKLTDAEIAELTDDALLATLRDELSRSTRRLRDIRLADDAWLATLRDELTNAEKAELFDACHVQHYFSLIAGAKELNKQSAHSLWLAICLGAHWRELTLRSVEAQAAAGQRSHAGAKLGGKKRTKTKEAKRADANDYARQLEIVRRQKPHVGFVDATDAVGDSLRLSGRTIREGLKTVGVNARTFAETSK